MFESPHLYLCQAALALLDADLFWCRRFVSLVEAQSIMSDDEGVNYTTRAPSSIYGLPSTEAASENIFRKGAQTVN